MTGERTNLLGLIILTAIMGLTMTALASCLTGCGPSTAALDTQSANDIRNAAQYLYRDLDAGPPRALARGILCASNDILARHQALADAGPGAPQCPP